MALGVAVLGFGVLGPCGGDVCCGLGEEGLSWAPFEGLGSVEEVDLAGSEGRGEEVSLG